jgi:hypothetical protein
MILRPMPNGEVNESGFTVEPNRVSEDAYLETCRDSVSDL